MMDDRAALASALAGRYDIEREIGRGGMATVYLARDVRHDRRVAIKVLHPDLAAALGAERFLAEIRTTANLQHPHILPLHDSGDAGGNLFYVMPFVEGETLRHRLEREGPLPIDDAQRIAREMLSALGYAHRHGVVHRDIKPENILLHDGSALVADFGIALAVQTAGGPRMTQTGLSLGTPQYMAPEQAMGERNIDARADIYAAAAVVYEMLTGDPPFTGSSVQAIVAKVMTERPTPPRTTRDTVPVHVETAVMRGLAKLPADRFASASQFADALGDASRPVVPGESRNERRDVSPRAFAAVSLLAITAALAALWGWMRPREASSARVVRYVMGIDTAAALSGVYNRLLITPDGSHIVYTGGAAQQLYVRSRDKLESTLLSSEPVASPAISPDGRHVAYFTGRGPRSSLKMLPLEGGAPSVIRDSAGGRWGLSWGKDGYLYFGGTSGGFNRIIRTKATPESPLEVVSTPDTAKGEFQHLYPEVLPNGKGVLTSVYYGSNASKRAVAVVDVKTHAHRILLAALQARYVPGGHLLYVTNDRTLMVVPFDQDAMRITGEPAVVAKNIALGTGIGRPADFSVSATGTLVYALAGARSKSQLVWVDRKGSVTPVDTAWTDYFRSPAVSPDGKQAVVQLMLDELRTEVWIKTLDHGPQLRISTAGQASSAPTWSPDGKSVLYTSDALGTVDLWSRRADGSAPPTLVLPSHGRHTLVESAWSPDGQWIVYRNGNEPTLYVAKPGSGAAPLQVSPLTNTIYSPAFSPDGHWLAYSANESGRGFAIVVVPFPDVNSARYVVAGDGFEPRWSRDGKEIFYRARNAMWAAEIRTTPLFSVVRTTSLFPLGNIFSYAPHQQYDVAPGGRFLMIRPLGRDERDQVVVVDNWFTELEATSPSRWPRRRE